MDAGDKNPQIDADQRRYRSIIRRTRCCYSVLRCSMSTLGFRMLCTHRGRLLLGLLLALTIWGFVDVRRRGYFLPESPQKHKTDLTVYTEAGAAFFDGRPPYEVCNPRGWTYVYPPMFAILLAPLHALPMQDQSIVWFFLCLAMCWGIYRESARIVAMLHESDDDRPRHYGACGLLCLALGTITAASVALPTLNCLQRGQVSIMIAYLLLLGLRLILCGRTFPTVLVGGVVLGLSINIVIVPLLPVAFFLLIQFMGLIRNRWRQSALVAPLGRQLTGSTVGVALGLVLFFLLLPAALIGWNANLRHLNTWTQRVLISAGDSTATPGFENDTHSVRNQCLGNALYRLGNFGDYMLAGGPKDPLIDGDNPPPRLMDAASVNTTLLFVRLTLLAALMLVGLRLGFGGGTLIDQAAGFGLACAVMLVVSPVSRNHYFVLLAPAVLFIPLWLNHRGCRRAAMILALVPGLLIFLQYILLPYVGRVGLLGLGTTGWVMAAMVLMDRASRSAPSDVLALNTTDRRPETMLGEAA